MTDHPTRTVLLHPAAVVSLGLLIINDHALKAAYGNWITGKLSDVAGLVVFPLLLVSVADHIARSRRRPPVHLPQLLGPAIVLTGLFFAGIQLIDAITDVYVAVITVVWRPVRVTQDLTDLIALPALMVAWWVGQSVDRARRFRPVVPTNRPTA